MQAKFFGVGELIEVQTQTRCRGNWCQLAASKTALGLHSSFILPDNFSTDNWNLFKISTGVERKRYGYDYIFHVIVKNF